MTITKLQKGLLATAALGFFAIGNAAAQANNFTAAETSVDNTFTLNYEVNGADQPEITNDGVGGNDAPTSFLVDRLVDLTVANTGGPTTVAPGQEDATLTFTLTNDGNDTQAYFLDVINAITASGDNFDPAAAAPAEITYVPVGGGAPVTFDPTDETTFPRLAADETITITVIQDIPAGLSDTNTGDIILVADTRDEADGDIVIIADTDGTNQLNVTDNVLADDFGTPAAQNNNDDLDADGAHSAVGTFIVAETEVTGVKSVSVFSESGAGCAVIPGAPATGTQYAVPGACVEYRITVTNNDEARPATAINVQDILPSELEYQAVAVEAGGDFTGTPSISAPATAGTDCATGACVIGLTGVELPAAPTGGSSQGVLVIRATIK